MKEIRRKRAVATSPINKSGGDNTTKIKEQ